jgi:restriction system protein
MAVWLVRAGRDGEDEASCLESSRAIVGFREVPDLTAVADWDEIRGVVARTFPSASQNRVGNLAGQLYAFRVAMEPGDIVALPRKRVGKIALGRVTGPYEYTDVDGERRHVRPVQWLNTDVPRANFGQDLLNSMGAFLTVCEIKRNDAELRIRAVVDGKPDPGLGTPSEATDTQPEPEDAAHAVLNLSAGRSKLFVINTSLLSVSGSTKATRRNGFG